MTPNVAVIALKAILWIWIVVGAVLSGTVDYTFAQRHFALRLVVVFGVVLLWPLIGAVLIFLDCASERSIREGDGK